MEKKVIAYWTRLGCTVIDSAPNMVTVEVDKKEVYFLMGHGLKELPKVGDVGMITFLKSQREPFGFWHYTPGQPNPTGNEYNQVAALNIDHEGNPAEHLGDGAYVAYDGFNILLRVNDHRNPVAVCLEPEAYRRLVKFVQQVNPQLNE